MNVGVPKVRDVDVGLQHAICLCIGVSIKITYMHTALLPMILLPVTAATTAAALPLFFVPSFLAAGRCIHLGQGQERTDGQRRGTGGQRALD